ncbi:TetR-like C-terminal domain-containing protein [Saccharothrix sp.]|uniref:TetR/AcrR family transcriptional regulator n=1 Tax=Saccharothrix sp. TaxID=1873460 RepID=UPI00281115CE|nr:TetR-like C-terminal domain-containing protein [Saccharothrix sp.]
MATLPRKPYHHGALRAGLVTAARALVDAEGAEGLTLRKAAAAAGVSHAAAYRHFADKASLVAAVMAQGFDELAALAEPPGTPLERLHGIGRAYLEFALANPSLYRLMFGSADVPRRADFPDLAAAEQRVYARMATSIEAAQESGELAPHPVADVTLLMSCVMHGLCSQLLAGLLPAADAPELARTVMLLVDKGLGAR